MTRRFEPTAIGRRPRRLMAVRLLVLVLALLLTAVFALVGPTAARAEEIPAPDVAATAEPGGDELDDEASGEPERPDAEAAAEKTDDTTSEAEPPAAPEAELPAATGAELPAATEEPVTPEGPVTPGVDGSVPDEPATADDASVPDPARVEVRVGGYRTGVATVSGLKGVTLGLFASESAAEPIDADWARARSGADGLAVFTVPGAELGGKPRYWVKALEGTDGYSLDHRLTTAPITNPNDDTARSYAFQTPRLEPGKTYGSGKDFMNLPATGTDYRASEGTWALSYDNPELVQQCGMSVALVVDLSASVLQAGATDDLRAAAKTYVDALLGTPSQVQLFSFGTTATASSDLTAVSTQANVDALTAKIDRLTPNSGNYTNWDDALWTVASRPGAFDLAVIVTDGNPTVYAKSQAGRNTRFAEVEAGIFSANALKREGTRIVALGVGDGVGSADAAVNLKAISGAGAYLQHGSYAAAGEALRDLVFEACTPSLTVVKQVVSRDGGTASPAAGWTFEAATDSDEVSSLADSGTTDGTGAVNFPVEFAGPSVTEVAITITEVQQDGYVLVPQDGQNAVCTMKNKGNPLGRSLAVVNRGDLAFTLEMSAGDMVSCVVQNLEADEPGDVPPADPEPDVHDLALREWVGEIYRDGVLMLERDASADQSGPDYDIPHATYDRDDLDVTVGDLLVHDLHLFNQGNQPARVRQLVDYLPAGLELADESDLAELGAGHSNAGWTQAANGNLYYQAPGDGIELAPGEESEVQLVLEVTPDAAPADGEEYTEIANYAEISAFEGFVPAQPEALRSARVAARAASPTGEWQAVEDVDSRPDDDNGWVGADALGVKFENNEIDEHDTTDEPDTGEIDRDNDEDDHDGDFLRVVRASVPEQPGAPEQPELSQPPALPEQPELSQETAILDQPELLQEPAVPEQPLTPQAPVLLEQPTVPQADPAPDGTPTGLAFTGAVIPWQFVVVGLAMLVVGPLLRISSRRRAAPERYRR